MMGLPHLFHTAGALPVVLCILIVFFGASLTGMIIFNIELVSKHHIIVIIIIIIIIIIVIIIVTCSIFVLVIIDLNFNYLIHIRN